MHEGTQLSHPVKEGSVPWEPMAWSRCMFLHLILTQACAVCSSEARCSFLSMHRSSFGQTMTTLHYNLAAKVPLQTKLVFLLAICRWFDQYVPQYLLMRNCVLSIHRYVSWYLHCCTLWCVLIHACVPTIDSWQIGQYYIHAMILPMFPAYKTPNDDCDVTLDHVSTGYGSSMILR